MTLTKLIDCYNRLAFHDPRPEASNQATNQPTNQPNKQANKHTNSQTIVVASGKYRPFLRARDWKKSALLLGAEFSEVCC